MRNPLLPVRGRRELYYTAAALSSASFDLGNFAAAETHAALSSWLRNWLVTTGYGGRIRGTQALIAYWDDRPAPACAQGADDALLRAAQTRLAIIAPTIRVA